MKNKKKLRSLCAGVHIETQMVQSIQASAAGSGHGVATPVLVGVRLALNFEMGLDNAILGALTDGGTLPRMAGQEV